MTDATYTLKEISYRLSPSLKEKDLRFIDRQIKHWTSSDLLRTSGEKHTGTGRSRQYAWSEVVAAAYLHELTAFGVTIGELKKFRKKFDTWMKDSADRAALFGGIDERYAHIDPKSCNPSYLVYFGPSRGFDLVPENINFLKSIWSVDGGNGKTYNFHSAFIVNCQKLNERINRS